MAFEFQDDQIISICVDCVYFNAYGRLDDQTMSADPHAAEKHKAAIAGAGWPYGTDFTPGCGRDCEEHGIAAYDSEEDWEAAQAEDSAYSEPWFSWSSCEQCGSTLGGDREHATAWTYKTDTDITINTSRAENRTEREIVLDTHAELTRRENRR